MGRRSGSSLVILALLAGAAGMLLHVSHGFLFRARCAQRCTASIARGKASIRLTAGIRSCLCPNAGVGTCRRACTLNPKLTAMQAVTWEVLAKQNSETTAKIIEQYAAEARFKELSRRLCNQIMARDTEDGKRLQKGIQLALDKGVLPKDNEVEPTIKVNVSGRTADAIADEIVAALGEAPSKGCVMTLQGLSGIGKGTTVAKLKEKLRNAETWSNGNVFRSVTLLALTRASQQNKAIQDVLTPEDLDDFVKMLEFDKFSSKFDLKIEGLGLKYLLSEVHNTVLKSPNIAKNIPTVAEVIQGEVINFVQGAISKMAADGTNVLLEGREQTLNYIRTPHRFELVLDDPSVIGVRQAALQMGARAYDQLKLADDKTEDAVQETLVTQLNALVAAQGSC